MIQYNANYSRSVLFQFLMLSVVLGFLLLLNHEFLLNFYFKNQATNTGYIVNGSILVLFIIGIFRVISLLLRYSREENALARFIQNMQDDASLPTERINKNRLKIATSQIEHLQDLSTENRSPSNCV